MDIFHRHRNAGEHELAASVLERAMQIAEHRPEALIWKGIAALPRNPKLAFLFLVTAAQLLPERADVKALAGRALLAQGTRNSPLAISPWHGRNSPGTPRFACCYGKHAASLKHRPSYAA